MWHVPKDDVIAVIIHVMCFYLFPTPFSPPLDMLHLADMHIWHATCWELPHSTTKTSLQHWFYLSFLNGIRKRRWSYLSVRSILSKILIIRNSFRVWITCTYLIHVGLNSSYKIGTNLAISYDVNLDNVFENYFFVNVTYK